MAVSFLKKSTAFVTTGLLSATILVSCSGNSNTPIASNDVPEGEVCAPEIAEIDFGIISTESQENLKTLWEPFLAVMATEMERPVNGFYATDYAGVIEAMGAGKIQIAWYGGKSYIEAAARSQAEAFAQTVADDGSKGYYSHLITNKANPIVSEIDLEAGNGDQFVIENAESLTFAFNDPNSTSGFLVPTYYVFAQNSQNADSIFAELIFAGSHEATAQAVANNQVDVATNNSESLTRLEQSDPEAFEQVQVIWTSPVIPSDPIAYRQDLPECLKEQMQAFFYNISDEAVLGPLGWSGFDQAGDVDWNTIRELELGKQILQVQSDETLSNEEKQTKVAELNEQLETLK